MKPIFLTLILLACFTATKATPTGISIKSKHGLTISYGAAFDLHNEIYVDSILNEILRVLKRKDTSLKVLVMVNDAPIFYPYPSTDPFISMAFDTLRRVNDEFIRDYYFAMQKDTTEKYYVDDFFFEKYPLDINATDERTPKHVGLKIIYNSYSSSPKQVWYEIEKLILYGLSNIELLKRNRHRDTVGFCCNGWHVSLLTIDSSGINKILGKEFILEKQKRPKGSSSNYWILGLIGLPLIIGFIVWSWQRGRQQAASRHH